MSAAPRAGAGHGKAVALEVRVQLQRVDVGLVPPAAEGVAHQPRGVADGVAAVERGHPLVDPHRSTGARRSSSSAPKSTARREASARDCVRSTARPQRVVGEHAVDQGRHLERVLLVQQDAAAAEGLRHRPRVVGDHGQAEHHRLQQRHPEALVLGEAQEQVGHRVTRHQLVVLDVAGKDDLVHAQRAHHLREAREVALVAAVVAGEDQPALRVERLLVRRERPDEVVDLLVRDHAADEQDVGPAVVVQRPRHRRRRGLVLVQVEHDGQHAGARVPRRLQLPAVVLAVARGPAPSARANADSSRRPW